MTGRKIDRNLLYVFLSVPALSSVMSALHLVNMVSLGNPFSMAVALAITFELGSIVSFVALSKDILKKLKKEMLYFIFAILFILQSFGNVYSSFDYIRINLIRDPKYLDSFREMFFNAMDVTTTKLTLAILIGLPIPVISLVLLKVAADYFSADEDAPAVVKLDSAGNVEGANTYERPAILADSDEKREEMTNVSTLVDDAPVAAETVQADDSQQKPDIESHDRAIHQILNSHDEAVKPAEKKN